MPIFGDEGMIVAPTGSAPAPSNYSRNFNSESTGAATNYSSGGGTSGSFTIDDTVYYGDSGKSLKIDNGSSNVGHQWRFDSNAEALSGDVVLTCKVRLGTVNDPAGCRVGLVARVTDDTTDTCYVLLVRPQAGNTSFRLARMSGQTETNISTVDYGSQISVNTWYSMKFSLNGTALKGKLWLASDSEPGTWNIDTTDANYANTLTKVGVYFQDGTTNSRHAYIDEIVAEAP